MGRIRKSIEVEAPVHRVYRLWSDFESFPGFMAHVQEVRRTGARTTRWKVEAPLGRFVEWDAETTALEENRRIAWRATGTVGNSGEVRFLPRGGNRTEVEVELEYHPPAGKFGEAAARVFENPERTVSEDLRRFKDLAEGRAGM